MARYNKGMIYTNEKCISCNKCISECPVMGANVTVTHDGSTVIEVNEHICIMCGHCMSVCTHHARDYHDDTDRFFEDLKNGKKIAIAVSPSFYLLYPNIVGNVLGYLRARGAGKIYDVAFGADVAMWCHLKYFEENSDENGRCHEFISQACPAITNYIVRYLPEYVDRLIPIQSPAICLGIYAKKYFDEKNPIALISPCVTKKDEIDDSETKAVISYNITLRHLLNKLNGVDLASYPKVRSDVRSLGFGALFPIRGGMQKYMEYLTADPNCAISGMPITKDANHMREQIKGFAQADNRPAILDLLACQSGCVGGPARAETVRIDDFHPTRDFADGSGNDEMCGDISAKKRRELLCESFKNVDWKAFRRTFIEKFQQPFVIPEDAYEEIFASMYKYTAESRRIDCSLCGYNTCRDLATAIAYGYSHTEDCIQYAKERISRLYSIDELTGLYKETAGIQKALQIIKNNPGMRYYVCCMRINNFKIINEMYGFDMGDKVLRYCAQMFMRFVGADGACARLSSTNSMFICPIGTDKLEIFQSKQFFDLRELGVDMPLTMRMGVYALPHGETDMRRAIGYASMAASSQVDLSRNTCTFYDEQYRAQLVSDAKISSQMHDALINGEFVAYLQPQYNHSTSALSGAEVLCRWIKPDGEIVSPGLFIPVFEKNGFIYELDKYMWKLTFSLVRKWLDAGLNPVPVSTNISRISLTHSGIANEIKLLLDEYGIDPRLVHLEVTESAYMNDQKRIIEIVRKLQSYGFTIALDDFGTGYSSLNTLKDVPIDILKLDMGFFRACGDTEKSGNIIFSVMRMAQSMKLATIAEGVEKIEQADYLKGIGCNIIQGYLYSKPLPVNEYERVLASSKLQHSIDRPGFMEQINVNNFFSPSSGESRMFDNYIGPAVIVEYISGQMQITRVNDAYLDIYGLRGCDLMTVRKKIVDALSERMLAEISQAMEKAIETGKENDIVLNICIDGITHCVRHRFFIIAANGSRYTIYCLVDDLSNEKKREST